MSVIVKLVPPENEDLHQLIQQLDEYLLERYSPEEVFGVDFTSPAIRETVFAVAYDKTTPVGCGAIRPIDAENVELKRFFVVPTYRKQGIAGRIYLKLEELAKANGYKWIKLETGAPQQESIAFYKKHGFYAIDRFGEYKDCLSSLCFEKNIELGGGPIC